MTATRSATSATTPMLWVIMHDGEVELRPQFAEQVQELRLDDHVEGGGGLVGDDQVGPQRQGQGDHDPLAHAAGELVGVVVDPLDAEPEPLDELLGSIPGGRLGNVRLVGHDRLGEVVDDLGERVQRGHRILEDHAEPGAPDLPHPGLGDRHQVLAPEPQFARVICPGGEIIRIIALPRVDLPHPDSPTRPRISPFLMSSETRSTAATAPARVPYSTETSRSE